MAESAGERFKRGNLFEFLQPGLDQLPIGGVLGCVGGPGGDVLGTAAEGGGESLGVLLAPLVGVSGGRLGFNLGWGRGWIR